MRTIQIKNKNETEQVIRMCRTCFLAMCDQEQPYVVPMNFALDGETVIMHSAREGRKWETMRANPRVCLTWVYGEEIAWQDYQVGCSYRVKSKSVIAEGWVEVVDDFDEKVKCMEKLMAQYSPLTFSFSRPSIENVGVFKVHIKKLEARDFGVKAANARK